MIEGPGGDEQVLSDLLDAEWDPIGVYDGPREDWAPPGEYESYVPTLLALVREGRPARSLAAYLRDVAARTIGVTATGSEERVAERIIDWYRARNDRP